MGALPKRKISTHRKGKRRRNHGVTTASLSVCSNCGKPKLPHRVCSECQAYKTAQ